MIDFMNMLRGLVAGFFVTLTYPNNFPADSVRWRRDMDAFSKRFLREYPQAGAVWRKEFKRRKSGSNKGQIAPHFHLLVIGVNDLGAFRGWLAVAWFEVVASRDDKHLKAGTQAAKIESRRHAMHYVSKYLAKCDDDILTHDSGQPIPVGRWWGYFGTLDNIPSMTVRLTYQQLVELRRVAAALQRVRSRRVAKIIKRGKLGFAVWGAGDETDGITDLFDSLGFKLLQASGL